MSGRDPHYPVVFSFRSTVDADRYMKDHVAALERMGDHIFQEMESTIPAPVAIHNENCCMNGPWKNPHPECSGVIIADGNEVKNHIQPINSKESVENETCLDAPPTDPRGI